MKTIYQWTYSGYSRECGNVSSPFAYSLNKNNYPSWSYIDSDVRVHNVRYYAIKVTWDVYKFLKDYNGIVYTEEILSNYVRRFQEMEKKKREEERMRQEALYRQRQDEAKRRAEAIAAEKKRKEQEETETALSIIGLILYYGIAAGVLFFYALHEFGWVGGIFYSLFWPVCIPVQLLF